MMNERTSESSAHPSWIKLWIALSSALVVFRFGIIAAGFALWAMQGLPLPITHFLYKWDYLLVPCVSLILAVLVSRWTERRLHEKSRRARIFTALILTIIALFPADVRYQFSIKPVMVSPLQFAISQSYSLPTIEAIIDRYPRLVNGSDDPWDHYRPLVNAAFEKRTNLVELLVRKGANVDVAVQELQALNAEEAVKLVLDCDRIHRQVGTANRNTAVSSETNQTPSSSGTGH